MVLAIKAQNSTITSLSAHDHPSFTLGAPFVTQVDQNRAMGALGAASDGPPPLGLYQHSSTLR